jgi:hypothetical protein
MEDIVVRALLAVCLACLASGANADNLDFSATSGKRLKTETSPPGTPSVNAQTWTATCRRGIAIAGGCESRSGTRSIQNVGVVEGVHWVCTWTEATPDAVVTALCLFEE